MKPKDERPWTIEMPVRKSQFKPLLAKHLAFNIEADLSAMSGYAYKKKNQKERLNLHSDFQSDPMVETFPRLGAGRAGYYKDHYIKGVGRTLLTANWNWGADTLHHSGHLRACAATRELLVSDYLQAKGLQHLIVPCEGILVKPLDTKLKGFYEVVTEGKVQLIKPADLKFQALSLKSSAFARYTNFCWLVDNRTSRPELVRTFMKFFEYYLNPNQTSKNETLREKLENSISTLNRNFQSCVEIGLNWNAYHNNFAMDGRFIDIEGPLILGGPFLGNLFDHTYKEKFCFPHIGFEIIYVHRQIQTSLLHIANRLEESARLNRDIRGEIKDDLQAFSRTLRSVAEGPSSPFNWNSQIEYFEHLFSNKLALSKSLTKSLLSYAKGIRDFYFNGDSKVPVENTVLWKKPIPIMSPNTVQDLVLHPFKGFDVSLQNYSDSGRWKDTLKKVEGQRDLDNFLASVHDARKSFQSHTI